MTSDIDYYSKLSRNDGSRQSARLSKVLRPDYIPVDERSLTQLILAIRVYAKSIRFYEVNNRPNGTWLRLFENSDALILADAVNFNGQQLRSQSASQNIKNLDNYLNAAMPIICWFDRWLSTEKVLKHDLAKTLFVKVKKIIQEKLKYQALNVLILAEGHVVKGHKAPDLGRSDRLKMDDLIARWGIVNPHNYIDTFNQKCVTHKQQLAYAQKSFDALLRARMFVASQAMAVFNGLLGEQSHDPAAAMLLAFLKTYKKSQDVINQFPERLLEFYYDSVLKNQPEQGVGDRIFLQCHKSLDTKPVTISAGTVFHAGKTPDLKDMLYQTTGTTAITGAKLAALKTVYLQRHINISPENATASVSRIRTSDLFALQKKSANSDAVLGDEKSGVSSTKNNVFGFDDGFVKAYQGGDANIGLYITSELLYLKEGVRTIALRFELTDKTLDRFKNCIDKTTDHYRNSPCVKECFSGCSQEEGVHSFLALDDEYVRLSYSLYNSADKKLTSLCNIPAYIKRFCDHIKKELLDSACFIPILKGDTKWAELILEAFWLYLYLETDNIEVMSYVHLQLISRKIFSVNYRFPPVSEVETDKENTLSGSLDQKADSFTLESLRRDKYQAVLQKLDALPGRNDQLRMLKADLINDLELSEFALLMYYFSDAFSFQLSQEQAWFEKSNYSIAHLDNASGFKVEFTLDGDVSPIVAANPEVHGALHTSELPVIIVNINPLTRVYPYSLLQPFLITEASLSVEVEGLRDVSVHNEYGRADCKKPFMPFSAIPQQDSRFYLGAYEYAKKNVTSLSVTFTWKNLPTNYGGFAGHYQGYGNGLSNKDFNVNVTMLANGELAPSDKSLQQLSPLFEFSQNTQTLYDRTHLTYHYQHANPKIDASVTKQAYEAMVNVEHAYLCFRLRCSKKAFGHKAYPNLMSEVLTHNARRRKKRQLPAEPYTPEVARVEIKYTAKETIRFPTNYQLLSPKNTVNQAVPISTQQPSTTTAYYQTPLGLELSHRRAGLSGVSLFPQWEEDGNLYVGFSQPAGSETLCLYFQLNKDATHRANAKTHSLTWHYYTSTGWQALPRDKILSDSSNGLMHSGIVNLELPTDFIPHAGLLPKSQYWLRISTSVDVRCYATFQALSFDAVRLESINNATKLSAHSNGLSAAWRSISHLPGIQSYSQAQAAFSNSDVENNKEARVRVYERLRHKNRAITPWDYERLVLEKFPEVDLVKCLPSCKLNSNEPAPGHVLVVVMPRLLSEDNVHKQGHHLNAVVLTKIADMLIGVSPPNVKLEVINAVYEYVQVRCAVKFKDRVYLGERIKQLQEDLSAYISPWSKVGASPNLAWVIRTKEVEAFISHLDYIGSVTKVSLVKCYSNNQVPEYLKLVDTANPNLNSDNRGVRTSHLKAKNPITTGRADAASSESVTASYPWSLSLPSKNHYIDVLDDQDDLDATAQAVGISRLEIGNTFVIATPTKHRRLKKQFRFKNIEPSHALGGAGRSL